jgi:predicted small secreted protein
MNYLKKFTLLAMIFSSLTLTACSDNNAEEAGEELDEIVTDAGNAVEDACEDVKEGVGAEDKDC